MDDRTFDQKTALEWISTIESNKNSIRDKDIYPCLNEWLALTSPVEILEIGAGQGICSDKIDLRGRNYTGIDPSPFLIDRAQQLYPQKNRHFELGNAYGLPFLDSTFDSAFSVLVWHLLSDLQKAADELRRVLIPNGKFLIITANPDAYTLWQSLYTDIKIEGRRFAGKMQIQGKPESHDTLYLHSLVEITSSFKSAGLNVQSIETFRDAENARDQKFLISISGQRAEASQTKKD
jgi:SAM-dependent methyltransferase